MADYIENSTKENGQSESACDIPPTNEQTAKDLVERLYGLKVKDVHELNSFNDKNYRITIHAEYQNPFIDELSPYGYNLKIMNYNHSQSSHVAAQHDIQKLLVSVGFDCPLPVKTVSGNEVWQERPHQTDRGVYLVRLFTFVPGRVMHDIPYGRGLLYQLGVYIGKLHNVLLDFHDEAMVCDTEWDMMNVPNLVNLLTAITTEDADLVRDVIATFIAEIPPKVKMFQKGTIHGDIHDENILVREWSHSGSKHEETYDIAGIIDFEECSENCLVFDIATSICHLSIDCETTDDLDVGGHILAGYSTQIKLNNQEFDALKVLVAARYCTELVISEHTYSLNPGNEYTISSSHNGWTRLRRLWTTPKAELSCRWKNIIQSYHL